MRLIRPGGGSGGSSSDLSGTGSPEGVVVANPGRQYTQTDSGGSLWTKISGSGNTGWIQIGPGAAYIGPQIYTGDYSPEGVVAAVIGSTFHKIVAGNWVQTFIKVSGVGNTGWQ